MVKITYNTHDNKTHTIDVQNGLSVMEGAVQNDIPGIDADCGGGMACATCHVYVKEEWLDKLPTKENGEEDMLDMAFEPKKNSRLSCQLVVSDDLDGLRKVPTNVPNAEMLYQDLDLPLSKVRDPFGVASSFAEYNNSKLCEFLDSFNFTYQFLSSTECYKSGKFDGGIKL